MKKVLLLLSVLTIVLSVNLSASVVSSKVSIMAGGSLTHIDNDVNIGYSAGIGYTEIQDNGVVLGSTLELDYLGTDYTSLSSFGLEVKCGYVVQPNTSLYGIIGFKTLNYLNSYSDTSGLGYGIGAKFDANEEVGLEFKLTSYPMAINGYDFNVNKLAFYFVRSF